MHPKYWKRKALNHVFRDADNGDGNQNPGGVAAPTEAEKAAAAAADTAKAEKDAADAAAAAAAAGKPSDAEAKLLKEVMQKKEALKAAEADAAAARAALAAFEGIDPVAVRKLLDDQKSAEEAALAAKGDFDTLKARMAEEHTKAMTGVKAENQTLAEQLAAARRQIEELSIGSQFAQSKFISEESTMAPAKARKLFGDHFDTVDGQVVAYDKPRGDAGRAPLVDQYGNHVGFEDALRKIVDADPDKDSLLRSKVKPGAASTSQRTNNAAPAAKATDPASKIAAGLASLNFMGQKPA